MTSDELLHYNVKMEIDEENSSELAVATQRSPLLKLLKLRLQQHWFLLALVGLMTLGFTCCQSLSPLSDIEWLKWLIVTVTMFLMAWPLELSRLQQAVRHPTAAALGFAMNLVAIPLLVWPLAWLAGNELGPGLIVAAATPSTLASAAVFARRAGGDDSVSILITILTNGSCFLVMPFWIWAQTGQEIEPSKLTGTITKLLLFVVLPIAAAQFARAHRGSAAWATANKSRMGLLALCGVLSMVFLGAVKMGIRAGVTGESALKPGNLIIAGCIVLGVHIATFWSGIWCGGKLRLTRGEQVAVAFSGSQKTLMIGLTTAINLGMNIVPIVMYHAFQLIADAYFAEKIRTDDSRRASRQ